MLIFVFVLLFCHPPHNPGSCVTVHVQNMPPLSLSLSCFGLSYPWKSCRVLWTGWIGSWQGLPLAHDHFHWRQWVGSSTPRDHPPPGGKTSAGELHSFQKTTLFHLIPNSGSLSGDLIIKLWMPLPPASPEIRILCSPFLYYSYSALNMALFIHGSPRSSQQ